MTENCYKLMAMQYVTIPEISQQEANQSYHCCSPAKVHGTRNSQTCYKTTAAALGVTQCRRNARLQKHRSKWHTTHTFELAPAAAHIAQPSP
jgi:hypothetical protein